MEGTGFQSILMILKIKYIVFFLIIYTALWVSIIQADIQKSTNHFNDPEYLNSFLVYLKGNTYYKQNIFNKAIYEYKKAIKMFKEYPEPYYMLGLIYYNERNYSAVDKFVKNAGLYIDHFRNLYDKAQFYKFCGEYYEHQEQYVLALDHYLKFNSIISNNPEINYKIGFLYYKNDQTDNSILYLIKFIHDDRLKRKMRITYSEEIKNSYKIIVNLYMDKKQYQDSMKFLKEFYFYYPDKEIKERITILSNNILLYNK